ncbi:hypothetical protein TBLA_0C06810 [Henningerozyma blattae CBS 6284]|uniref:Uncharacterized protein n=1 Tax=Henningerozyma blattae (strain ATCC 34711 / CBS 6284 / DSM 70876 / NBRC 10599 / NRRL Y-10934 / UCD 77-7) TaxID=1071380 RepID=I2H271_HENB6|nr:hypothetical protein TBLA_0C06810 [Tetrapisispora blattae CBS 6284]CCH60473.1 hypothetical protein TBLA_0C06810 [Tetrapisispora blattae CBS 6284]
MLKSESSDVVNNTAYSQNISCLSLPFFLECSSAHSEKDELRQELIELGLIQVNLFTDDLEPSELKLAIDDIKSFTNEWLETQNFNYTEKEYSSNDEVVSFSFELSDIENKSTETFNNKFQFEEKAVNFNEQFYTSSEEEILDFFHRKDVDKVFPSKKKKNTSFYVYLKRQKTKQYRDSESVKSNFIANSISTKNSCQEVDKKLNCIEQVLNNYKNLDFRLYHFISNSNSNNPHQIKEAKKRCFRKYSKQQSSYWKQQRKLNIQNNVIKIPQFDSKNVLENNINILKMANLNNILSFSTNRYGNLEFFTMAQIQDPNVFNMN